MSERRFFREEARTAVREAIETVESQTSAELVVAVRPRAASYLAVDVLVGCLAAFGALLLLLFHPMRFTVAWMPAEVALAFLLGCFLSWGYGDLKRWVVPAKYQRRATWREACTVFHERRISATSRRNGLLVYVSLLERRVEVVTDIGIDTDLLGEGWPAALESLQATVRKPDLTRFVDALKALGPLLGAEMPRDEHDINELTDEMDL
jgi:putative membrane protein